MNRKDTETRRSQGCDSGLVTEEVQLRFIKERVQMAISRQVLEYLVDPSVVIDRNLESIVVDLKAQILAENEPFKTYSVSWPADWWQHFKERWFPEWLKQRFPVSHEKTAIDMFATYPECRQKLPEETYGRMRGRSFAGPFWTQTLRDRDVGQEQSADKGQR
jgi:hypothetical protein